MEEEDPIIVKWTQEDVETFYNLLNNNNNNNMYIYVCVCVCVCVWSTKSKPNPIYFRRRNVVRQSGKT